MSQFTIRFETVNFEPVKISKGGNHVVCKQTKAANKAAKLVRFGQVYLDRDQLASKGLDVSTTAKAKKSLGIVSVKVAIRVPVK